MVRRRQRNFLLEKQLGSTLSRHATTVYVSVCVSSYWRPLFGDLASGAEGGRARTEKKKNEATFVF